MLSLANSAKQRDPIILSDKVLEQSTVLAMMLDIVYTLKVDCARYKTVYKVLGLAEKWELESILRLIKLELQRYNLDCDTRRFKMFELSLEFKDPSLISHWVKKYHHINWEKHSGPFVPWISRRSYEEAVQGLKDVCEIGGAGIFEVGGWAYQTLLVTPPTVVWALLRATHLGTTQAAEIDYDVVAEEFEKLLTRACKLYFTCPLPNYDQSADIQTNRNQM
jgi:hypothetical protein